MVDYGNRDYERPDWAGKERRMVRMNSNTNAVAVVLELAKQGRYNGLSTGITDQKVMGDLKAFSEFFEGLVYKGFPEEKNRA